MIARMALLLVRATIAGVFLYAGWIKAAAPAEFIRDIWNYQLLPEAAAYWLAAAVPYVEIVAALALVTGVHRRGAHLILGALLLVFVVFLASAAARGLNIACGCFGPSATAAPAPSFPWLIARDLLLLAGIVVSAVATQRAARPRAQARAAPTT